MSRRGVLILATLSAATVAFYVGCVRPTIQALRQVKTTANMQTTCRYLEQYLANHKALPVDLAGAIPSSVPSPDRYAFLHDAWDHPLFYQARGASFILVSYGSDSAPDGLDYWSIRSRFGNAEYNHEACSDPRSDLIASDLAFQRPCGK